MASLRPPGTLAVIVEARIAENSGGGRSLFAEQEEARQRASRKRWNEREYKPS
jgi:hypothetical protein